MAVSDSNKGVGVYIGGLGIDNALVALMTNTDVFPQNHLEAHKMELVYDLFSMPYKISGKVDYYVDDVYNRSYTINLTSNTELHGIYAIGAYFNTGSTTQKTYAKTGVFHQGGTVVAP